MTVALRRADLSGENDPYANILDFIDPKKYLLLPNTSGAMNAEEAVRLSGERDPNILDTLATAQTAAGRHAEARSTAARALEAAERRGNTALARSLRRRYALDWPETRIPITQESGTLFSQRKRPEIGDVPSRFRCRKAVPDSPVTENSSNVPDFR